MRKYISLLFVILTSAMIVLPHFADARAGGGRSVGSRGTRTYQSSPSNAQPISRSVTAQPSSAQQSTNVQPFNQPAVRSPFWSGLAGGFLGAGLFHMLFGGNSYAGSGGMGGSGIGFFELLLLGGGAYYLFKRMSSGAGVSSAPGLFAVPSASQSPSALGYTGQAPASSAPLQVTDADKHEFETLLLNIQQAWGNADLSKLRQYVTPEMLQYFSEELSANASQGLANKVEQVVLQKADMVESWNEYNLDYATAYLEWSALDYMYRLDKNPADTGYIASGSNQSPSAMQEVWTFVRSSGGHWLLSAIQQTNS